MAVERFYIVDVASGSLTRPSASIQGYTEEGYRRLLAESGYALVERFESMGGPATIQECLEVLVARKR